MYVSGCFRGQWFLLNSSVIISLATRPNHHGVSGSRWIGWWVRSCQLLLQTYWRGRLTKRSQNPGFYSNVETTDQQDNYWLIPVIGWFSNYLRNGIQYFFATQNFFLDVFYIKDDHVKWLSKRNVLGVYGICLKK